MKLAPLLLTLFTLTVHAQDIQISVDGTPTKKISLEDIRKLRSETVEFYNFVTKRSEQYKGTPALQFLERLEPEAAGNLAEVELTTESEFSAYIPREMFNKADAYFTYERADGDTFTRFSQKKKILVPLAPLYLVWNLKGIPKEERLNFTSTYQIKGMNLITKSTSFGVMENAVDQSVYLGLQAYKKNCISCHAIGKLGGTISFDLVKRNTVDVRGAEYVKKYILNPAAMNPKTQMLPLPQFKNQEQVAQGIVEFLVFMKNPEELMKKREAQSGKASYRELREVINQSK